MATKTDDARAMLAEMQARLDSCDDETTDTLREWRTYCRDMAAEAVLAAARAECAAFAERAS